MTIAAGTLVHTCYGLGRVVGVTADGSEAIVRMISGRPNATPYDVVWPVEDLDVDPDAIWRGIEGLDDSLFIRHPQTGVARLGRFIGRAADGQVRVMFDGENGESLVPIEAVARYFEDRAWRWLDSAVDTPDGEGRVVDVGPDAVSVYLSSDVQQRAKRFPDRAVFRTYAYDQHRSRDRMDGRRPGTPGSVLWTPRGLGILVAPAADDQVVVRMPGKGGGREQSFPAAFVTSDVMNAFVGFFTDYGTPFVVSGRRAVLCDLSPIGEATVRFDGDVVDALCSLAELNAAVGAWFGLPYWRRRIVFTGEELARVVGIMPNGLIAVGDTEVPDMWLVVEPLRSLGPAANANASGREADLTWRLVQPSDVDADQDMVWGALARETFSWFPGFLRLVGLADDGSVIVVGEDVVGETAIGPENCQPYFTASVDAWYGHVVDTAYGYGEVERVLPNCNLIIRLDERDGVIELPMDAVGDCGYERPDDDEPGDETVDLEDIVAELEGRTPGAGWSAAEVIQEVSDLVHSPTPDDPDGQVVLRGRAQEIAGAIEHLVGVGSTTWEASYPAQLYLDLAGVLERDPSDQAQRLICEFLGRSWALHGTVPSGELWDDRAWHQAVEDRVRDPRARARLIEVARRAP